MATQDRVPTGNGTDQSDVLVIVGGDTFHYQAVDDPIGTPDDNTTYLSRPDSGSSGTRDTYTFTAFSINSSAVASITVTGRAKETGGNRTYSAILWVNGVRYTGSSEALTTSYANYTEVWATNPNTGSAWTEADVEGTGAAPLTEFGFLHDGPIAGRTAEYTQFYCTVDYTDSGGATTKPWYAYAQQ